MKNRIIGSELIRLAEVGSTNTYAQQLLLREKPKDGTIILTERQVQGRGMDTNQWESEPGKNLTFTIILYPAFMTADRQFVLNQSIVLGIVDFIRSLGIPEPVRVKWPNDIYLADRKVGGILIQHSILGQHLHQSIIGIGLNINQEHFLSDAPNPVSLKQISGMTYDLSDTLNALCTSLDTRYMQLNDHDWGALSSDYLNNLYRLGEWHAYNVKGTELTGMIIGINEPGQLKLQSSDGKVYVCDIKEVKYL